MQWTFFSNHAHVLFLVAQDPDARLRDVAARVGITERATTRIVAELAAAGYLQVTRAGRRNRYAVVASQPFRHPVEAGLSVGDVLALLRRQPAAPLQAGAG
jgi:DNA-binding Lrp family transcriptional regulator